jgi:hypothetical protein
VSEGVPRCKLLIQLLHCGCSGEVPTLNIARLSDRVPAFRTIASNYVTMDCCKDRFCNGTHACRPGEECRR